ncbi:hypothetical protein DW352_02020 [Pseudolabrys taiwanensis]|uniref:Uncharacterized protein n=1 Tax=Pseudolabrys taiwanensis TaxID=331696 RepID=A0A345ZR51_9HYPH|nr:hypothetical protein [Pseudolabrys taiwanensis]AXK79398.1 hypothetical protein DW352_02020 [Pseudolabrys taiwanensis]
MSNGDYCLVRSLGLVPGGKGMKHHENLLRLTPAGVASKLFDVLRGSLFPSLLSPFRTWQKRPD